MLHLNFALNFEILADHMMDALQNAWKDPFCAPVVIFPDTTLEQWFKLRWIAQRGVLANLNTIRLDQFLYQILRGEDAGPQRLSPDLLRNLIYAWLKTPSGSGLPNWKTLGENVSGYLQNNETPETPDENRLFDFSCLMSDLFLQYETSRPSEFMSTDGLLKCWKSDEPRFFFSKENAAVEEWQRRLYRKLFCETESERCLLSSISETSAPLCTLPALYETCIERDSNTIFHFTDDTPLFMFWHAGMGQYYRIAIRKFAQKHEVYAFVQNPCMEFWEDVENSRPKFKKSIDEMASDDGDEFPQNENELLKRWGRAGRDNIKLWCQDVDYDFNFEDTVAPSTTESNSLLHRIQLSVANRCSLNQLDESIQQTTDDDSLTLTAAPTKIREIEALHSQICRLMLEKDVNVKDILVVAPDINAYRTAIYQVFDQETERARQLKLAPPSAHNQNETALHIPFTIIDGAPCESLTARAIRSLLSLCNNPLSRPIFFELARNPLVQTVRRFSADEVNTWQNWISDLNVYRDRKKFKKENKNWTRTDAVFEDWKNGLDRLILAKLSNNKIDANGNGLLPYSNIDTGNCDSLFKFADCIDSLEELSKYARQHPDGLTQEELETWFIPFLNSWISMPEPPKSLATETAIYQTIVHCIEDMKIQYAAGTERISWRFIEQSLSNAAENTDYTLGTIFVNGITFMNFTSNRIIPVKHVFMIGMDASSFPGRNIQNSLDLRLSAPWPGDVIPAARNRYAFLCQLMSTRDGFHISYVNKNLQKDEIFLPSGTVTDLRNYIGKDENDAFIWKENVISLDETRPWNELFTGREFRNRELHDAMLLSHPNTASEQTAANDKTPNIVPLSQNLPERVKLWEIKKYLDDPFQFRVGKILCEDEEDIDPEKIMYEHISLDMQYCADFIQTLALLDLRVDEAQKKEQPEQENATTSQDSTSTAVEKCIEEFFQELNDRRLLPDGMYADVLKQDIKKHKDVVVKQLQGDTLVRIQENREAEIPIEQDLCNGTTQKWTLFGKLQPHTEEKDLVLGVNAGNGEDKTSKYLKCFVTALFLLVEKGREAPENYACPQDITLWVSCYGSKPKRLERRISLSPADAEEILKKIYRYAYIEQYFEAAPMKLIEKNIIIQSLNEFINELESKNGPWFFFKKGKLFDKKKDIGYTEETFKEQWETTCNRQLQLVSALNAKNTNINTEN